MYLPSDHGQRIHFHCSMRQECSRSTIEHDTVVLKVHYILYVNNCCKNNCVNLSKKTTRWL